MIRFYREDIKKELLRMINRDSNKVYVVSIAQGNPESCSITWRDIVKKKSMYFHPVGGKGYIKNPPNYIAFRYDGRLQSIHYIESVLESDNLHNQIFEMPDSIVKRHYVYTLGTAILPIKETKTGDRIINARHVWYDFDTLLTCDTISEAELTTNNRKI